MTEQIAEERKKRKRLSRELLIIFGVMTLIFVGTSIGFSIVVLNVRNLGKENKHRIFEIQDSRVESCKGTYRGIREVFKPFFPAAPRTKEQQADLDKFNRTIAHLQKGCVKQTKTKVDHR